MPVAGAKRLRGGRRTTVSKVRHRTGVHGYSPVLRGLTTLKLHHSAIFARFMVRKALTGAVMSFRGDAQHRTSDVQLHIGEARDSGSGPSAHPEMTMRT